MTSHRCGHPRAVGAGDPPIHADKGYDSHANRGELRRGGINARIARRGIESSTRLGRHRWRVERSLSWLSCFRRLQLRWFAFVLLACAVVCFSG
jgi:IS5 family transposase